MEIPIESIAIIFWGIVIIIGIIVELMSLGLVSIWFSIAAVIPLILAILGVDPFIQIIVFLLLSAILILYTRRIASKYLIKHKKITNFDRVIGQIVKVTKDITLDNKGEVYVDGKFWSASVNENIAIYSDDHCKIEAVQGVTLIVSKINNKGE